MINPKAVHNRGEYMKKNKLLAFLLSAALMAQPVICASANVNVNETVNAQQEETQDMSDVDEMNSESDESMAATESESESEVRGNTSDAQNSNRETEQQNDVSAAETKSESETGVVSGEETDSYLPEGMAVGGYIHSDLDYNTPVYYGDSDDGISVMSSDVPAAYPCDDPDKSVANIKEKYPEVRNQGNYGTCWAFSSLGIAEFDLISKDLLSKVVDLSELQLAYFTYNFVQDPLGGTVNDTAQYFTENSSTNTSYLDYGGNYEMAVRRLGQWISATDEAVVPYSESGNVLEKGLDEKYAYNYDKVHLENAYLINIKQNSEDVKKQIVAHGAVGVMYTHLIAGSTYAGTSYDDNVIQAPYNAYFDSNDTVRNGGNHAVMIVGWDDNFSKDNFMRGEKPSSDGAWLVRNSWGENSYNFDYFWMSYETSTLSDTAWVLDFAEADNYDNNYQLDGGIKTYKSTNGSTVANIYSVSEKQGVKSETLKAVSLSFTHAADIGYTVDIYTDLTSKYRPTSGTKQTQATTSGRTTYAGVYTIPLENPVELKSGTTFSIVVTMDQAAMDCEDAVNIAEDINSDKYLWKCTVSLADYNSYYQAGNGFASNYNNYCMKGYTTNNYYTINYELYGGTNDPSNPSTCGSEAIELKDPTREGCKFEGWYLDSDYNNKITEIPANASQDYTLYAKWSSATGETLKYYTLTLDGKIGINFYFDIPEDVVKNENAYMEFTLPTGKKVQQKVNSAPVSGDYHVFTCGVAAKEMISDVTARLVVDDCAGKTYVYSVKKYADYILEHETQYADSINVIKAMLNYGAAAQQVFEYHTDELVNEKMTSEDKDIKRADFSDHRYSYEKDSSVTGISYYGSALSLESGTDIINYFTLQSGYNIDDYSFSVIIDGGEEIDIQPMQSKINQKMYYCAVISDIKGQNLNQTIVTVIRNKSDKNANGIRLSYNAFSYGQALNESESPDENLVKVMNALYYYWKEAKAFVDGKNT